MRYPPTPAKALMIVAAAILFGAPVSLAASTSSRSGSHHASTPSVPAFGSGDGEPADTSLLHQCTMLSKQFDQAKGEHKTDKSYTEALTLSNEGKAMCRSIDNKQAAGVEYLRSAMKLIGIKANI